MVLPVGRMTAAQMRGLASIADRFGSGDIRLTVWQNLIIPDINDADIERVKAEIEITRPPLVRNACPRRAGGLHRKRRLQIRRLQHQGTCVADRRSSGVDCSSINP